jgi:hypothetical protein
MSELETPMTRRYREPLMTRRYWQQVSGTLLEEYLVVSARPGVGWRRVDAVIIADGDHKIASPAEYKSLNGCDLIVVQTKATRLSTYLLGQAFFSPELINHRFSPRSVHTVALCGADDAILRPIAERFGIEVVVDDLSSLTTFSRGQALLRQQMTRRYWQRIGGTLLEKYCVVPASRGIHGQQVVDAIIITDSGSRIASRAEHGSLSLDGCDLIIVNTSAAVRQPQRRANRGRLGMYLLGQALFSREVIKERLAPRSVRTVALCADSDAVLRPIAERHGIEVVVDDLGSAVEN